MLEVDVRKTIGPFTLEVAFAAPSGITALFGPSGSGKTLTLRGIAGLLRPERGRVAIGSRVLFDSATGIDLPTRDRRIGYVFQHYALFPHLTAAANIAYGLHSIRPAERPARVAEMLALIDLPTAGERYPHELSGGEQQRVALARALAPWSELVLLDEPFAAVDAYLRGKLRDQLRAIHERTGVPMILVTHDLDEVRHIADSLVVYGRGKVIESGATSKVIGSAVQGTQPAHART